MFFREHGVDVQEWLTDDVEVANLMSKSEQLLKQHMAPSQRPAPQPPRQPAPSKGCLSYLDLKAGSFKGP